MRWVGTAIGLSCLWLGACVVGAHHTADAELEKRFLTHESEFEALLADVQADPKLEMINATDIRYGGRSVSLVGGASAAERVGLSAARLERYEGLLRRLGIAEVTKGAGDVEFRVDQGSFSNGDSYKGYEYSLSAPEHARRSLDEYRASEPDRDSSGGYYVCKPLKGSWRLYLFVNG